MEDLKISQFYLCPNCWGTGLAGDLSFRKRKTPNSLFPEEIVYCPDCNSHWKSRKDIYTVKPIPYFEFFLEYGIDLKSNFGDDSKIYDFSEFFLGKKVNIFITSETEILNIIKNESHSVTKIYGRHGIHYAINCGFEIGLYGETVLNYFIGKTNQQNIYCFPTFDFLSTENFNFGDPDFDRNAEMSSDENVTNISPRANVRNRRKI